LTVALGYSAPEARICYERAESLCGSLNRPLLLYSVLMGRWRYSLMADKLTATLQVAKRIYSLAQEQSDATLLIGAYRVLSARLYFRGDFETSAQYAKRGVQLWRSESARSPVEEIGASSVGCLCYQALTEWHSDKVASSSHATMGEATSLAKALNDPVALVQTLNHAWFSRPD
jgi:hypothetical protein